MNIPNHEAKSGSTAVIAEVQQGLRGYEKEEISHGVTKVTVYKETPDFITKACTDIFVTSGTGLLVYKDGEGTIRGRRILETDTMASLATGVRYSYWVTTGVFNALEYAYTEQVTPETLEEVIDLQQ